MTVVRTKVYFGKVCAKHPTFNGERQNSTNVCVACARESGRVRSARHRKAHPEKTRSWRPENREKHRQRVKRWQSQNPGRHEDARQRWRKENMPKVRAKDARRAAAERAAMPASATKADKRRIEEIYQRAHEQGLTVDHIIPIAGCRRCGAKGMHEADNLQVMPSSENKAKRDRCQSCWERDRFVPLAAAA